MDREHNNYGQAVKDIYVYPFEPQRFTASAPRTHEPSQHPSLSPLLPLINENHNSWLKNYVTSSKIARPH